MEMTPWAHASEHVKSAAISAPSEVSSVFSLYLISNKAFQYSVSLPSMSQPLDNAQREAQCDLDEANLVRRIYVSIDETRQKIDARFQLMLRKLKEIEEDFIKEWEELKTFDDMTRSERADELVKMSKAVTNILKNIDIVEID
jgi:hypothetical protein